jgi:hypothetical protein
MIHLEKPLSNDFITLYSPYSRTIDIDLLGLLAAAHDENGRYLRSHLGGMPTRSERTPEQAWRSGARALPSSASATAVMMHTMAGYLTLE